MLVVNQARQHTGTALGGFVEQHAAAGLAVGQGLGQQFALFELVDRLDAAFERVLQRRDGGLAGIGVSHLQQQRVLVVHHPRHDGLADDFGRVGLGTIVFIDLGPGAVQGVDHEAVLGGVSAAAQAFVQAADLGAGAVA